MPPSSSWAGLSLQKGPLTSEVLDPGPLTAEARPWAQRAGGERRLARKAHSQGEQKNAWGRKEKGDSESEGKKKELRPSAEVRKSTLAGKPGSWLLHLRPLCPQRASPGTLRVP